MTQFSSGALEVEYTAGNWTSLNSRLRMPVSIRRGRATLFEDVGASVLTAICDNDDGDLMPDLIGTTGYPNVVRGKRLRWKVTKSATTYTRFLGWIQAIEPSFPGGSLADARVKITATDSLSLLAQKKLHSNWTEQNLYQARLNSVEADAWEPAGQINGFFAYMSNYTENGGHPGSSAVYVINSPALSFGTDSLSSFGSTINVAPDSSDHVCCTWPGISTGSLAILFMFKSPSVHTPNTSIPYTFATLFDSGGTKLANLTVKDNGGVNGYFVYDGPLTTSLGFVGNIGYSQWHVINISQNGGNVAQTDFGMVRCVDGSNGTLNGMAVDIRNVASVQLPGFQGNVMAHSSGGLIAIKRHAALQAMEHSMTTGNATLTERMTSLAGACARLPLAFTQVGDWGALGCTGDWSNRTALDVGSEIARTTRNITTWSPGILFARPRDSQVLAIAGSLTHPAVPIATIDWEQDMLEGIELANSVDQDPTRVIVSGPQVTVTAVDSAAEAAGQYRELPISTISRSGFSDASDIANFYLRRNDGLRISRLKIDLAGAVNDPTAALFDESGTNTGLFPSAKIRLAGMPTSHFTYPTRDIHIEGWTEVYSDDEAYIFADCSPAQIFTLATDQFTGTTGVAWSAQWVLGESGGNYTIQTNRGRSESVSANGFSSRRLNITATADCEFTGSVILNNSAVTGYAFVRSISASYANSYALRLTGSGIGLDKNVASVTTSLATVTKTLTVGTQYGWRIRIVGPYINARTWVWGVPEQKGWEISLTDSSVTAAGYAALGVRNDAVATTKSLDWDDIVLTDAGSGV